MKKITLFTLFLLTTQITNSQAVAPYTQNFNGIVAGGDNSAIVENWDQYFFGGATSDTDIWNGWSLNPGLAPGSVAYTLYHDDDETATGTGVDDWFVLHLDCTQLTEPLFNYVEFQTFPISYYEFHGVYYSEDYNPANGSGASEPNGTWVELTQGAATTTPTQRSFTIPNTSTAIAFRFTGEYADNWFIDDIDIIEGSTFCPSPSITGWTMTNDGVEFNGTNDSSITGYELEYSPSTFTPGDGTATLYQFDSFPHTLTGLASGTYYFAMRSVCSNGSYSDYIGPDPWTTSNCVGLYTLPYSNDFEDFDAWQSCNTYFDSDGDNNYWNNILYDSDGDGTVDNRYAASFSYDNNAGPLTPDNWVIFGPIDLANVNDATMTWKAMGTDQNWCAENYSVYVGTEPTVSNLLGSAVSFSETFPSGTPGPGGGTFEPGCGSFADRSLDISAMVGNQVYVGFRHHGVTDMYVLAVDELAVTSESLGVQNIEQTMMNYFYDDVAKAVTINSSNAPLSELIVYNMLGQVVSEKTTTKSSETIDMSTFDKGVYIIKAFSELGTKTMRVINY
ncbi:MAG: hypothetical protein CMC83_07565 [Flavobacteriaceae bacterium]|nr:hypothetical protein [Flavobacteriaceae bacterium]